MVKRRLTLAGLLLYGAVVVIGSILAWVMAIGMIVIFGILLAH